MSAVTPIRAAQQDVPGDQKPAGPVPIITKAARSMQPVHPPSAAHSRNPPALRPLDEEAEVKAITRGTVQASMEVLAGIRPIHQLARRLDPRCLAALQHRACLIRRELTRTSDPALARLHRNSAVRSVRICKVSEGVYEASAVVVDDVRARAVAVRMERSKQVWRVTELVIG